MLGLAIGFNIGMCAFYAMFGELGPAVLHGGLALAVAALAAYVGRNQA